MKNNSYTIAVLGAGNIGSAVIERLENLDNEIVNIELKSVLVSDVSKDRTFNNDLVTDNFEEILNDNLGKPYFRLNNKTKKIIMKTLKVKNFDIFLSISDEKEYSIAFTIIQAKNV